MCYLADYCLLLDVVFFHSMIFFHLVHFGKYGYFKKGKIRLILPSTYTLIVDSYSHELNSYISCCNGCEAGSFIDFFHLYNALMSYCERLNVVHT